MHLCFFFFSFNSAIKRVTTHTSIPKFKAKQFSSMRRFSDFLGLHDLLVSKYLRLGRIIPPAPEKNLFGLYTHTHRPFQMRKIQMIN